MADASPQTNVEPVGGVAPTREERDPRDFLEELRRAVPRPWMTYLLAGLNVAAFAAMSAFGADALVPSAAKVIAAGANYAPATTSGGWWRLGASLFVHWGLFHLAINLVVLLSVGPLVERMAGRWNVAVVYFVSGLFGGVASLFWFPYIVSCGASPAIFGLYGVLLGFLFRSEAAIPRPLAVALVLGAVAFLGANLLYGLYQRNIDGAASIGGGLGGILCGLALAPSTLQRNARRSSGAIRSATTVLAGLTLVGLGAAAAPRRFDPDSELARAKGVDTQLIEAYNVAIRESNTGKLGESQFAGRLEESILPAWREERDRLRTVHGLPAKRQAVFTALSKYFEERYDGWEVLEKALQSRDAEAIAKAEQQQDAAEKKMAEFGHSKPNAK